ncbi:membrane protein [Clostridium acetobutylicum EA 2018]|uniref:Predicted membrane protein n=1 Tax=Clostridium acetobutylicum (strain ATCC 824 / DSM 792 / JCM 1419 / IAM 19013 / LMG 5710 / NBRC 13948 / NRRL B-527 / VKM B-1787 / 2291 / W) TaxID=272562 RepID=Q97LB5_CLOAB|nr:hypothetical protein [Clostridium acetobutylicum]AAK78624.1 Predicted membrane protein [Clostridium acetobutylicum ATCC 824]ADZ19698.1 membrane protein [Clostridium acetobutylicum EA 2018]AEI31353.1 hypothetical protein SMB_G0661 [Clostridium acetobutylicum DSM 1731]PSM06149.1 hypothetical protein C7T89_09610 [Clostridium sp. NJ4]AWV80347.1 hypothetical protein DK921_09615 [Clostridium acetobutylicum]
MSKTQSLTRGSIYAAVCIVFIYLSTIIPAGRLSFLAAASLVIPLSILTIGIRSSLMVYASTSILSLILLGFRQNVLIYILLFGNFGFVKLYIERIRKLPIELLLKLIYFNAVIFVIYTLYKTLFLNTMYKNFPIYIIVVILEFIFLLYDYIVSLFVLYINRHIIKNLK